VDTKRRPYRGGASVDWRGAGLSAKWPVKERLGGGRIPDFRSFRRSRSSVPNVSSYGESVADLSPKEAEILRRSIRHAPPERDCPCFLRSDTQAWRPSSSSCRRRRSCGIDCPVRMSLTRLSVMAISSATLPTHRSQPRQHHPSPALIVVVHDEPFVLIHSQKAGDRIECTSRRLRPPNGRRILTVRRSVQSRRRRVSHTEGAAAAGNYSDNRGTQQASNRLTTRAAVRLH